MLRPDPGSTISLGLGHCESTGNAVYRQHSHLQSSVTVLESQAQFLGMNA